MKSTSLAVTAVAMLLGTIVVPALDADRFLVNFTSSAPIGLYLRTDNDPKPGKLLVVNLPERLAQWAAHRQYLTKAQFLLKRSAAIPGDRICRIANKISLNGSVIATALASDPLGRPLPKWHGCFELKSHQVFLFSKKHTSFDGRYFGALDDATVIGTAIPLLTLDD